MKKLAALVALCILPLSQAHSQWTTPRVVNPTATVGQSNPMIAVGPNRELAIPLNEGKFVCYVSTDLGQSFSRIVIDSGGFRPPWYYFYPGTACNIGFDRNGNILLMKSNNWNDDLAGFITYSILRLSTDSARFSFLWYTSFGTGPGGGPSPLDKPTMIIEDTALHVLRDDRLYCPYGFVYMSLAGDSLRNRREYSIRCWPNSQYAEHHYGNLCRTTHAILVAYSTYKGLPTRGFSMSLSRKLHNDTTFAGPLSLDTVYSTLPCLVGLDSSNVALLYGAGSGVQYSDTLLVVRIFSDTATTFPSPFRVAAKPTRPVALHSSVRSPVVTTLGGHRYLVYRSYDASGSMVAYYQFGDLRSSPTDSAFFPGYDFGSLAVDSLGGKYLVMVGSDNKVYMTTKDVVSSVQDDKQVPSEMSLRQNYPNPFNSTTTISVSIIKPSFVQLKVFDLLGREVTTLVNERKSAGVHDVRFDASKLSSGVYFYSLHTGDFARVKRMVLLR